MAKVAHGFPVGMWAFNGAVGTATQAQFESDLELVYCGEPDTPYEACNTIATAGQGDFWGVGPNEPADPETRITNNIEGWIRYLEMIRNVTAKVGASPGTITGMISRDLAGLAQGGEGASWPLGPWDIDLDIQPYIKGLCYRIREESLEPYVAGWFLADEIFTDAGYVDWGVVEWTSLVSMVHASQQHPVKYLGTETAVACNFPIYWTDHVNIATNPIAGSRNFWNAVSGRWQWKVPQDFKDWVDAFNNLGQPEEPILVFQPFFYPYGSPAIQWRYRKHAFNADFNAVSKETSDNPPWELWRMFMSDRDPYTGLQTDSLRDSFPPGTYPNLRLEPIVEASSQGKRETAPGSGVWVTNKYPRHVDIHKTARVLLNLRKHWIDDLSDDRFTGMWWIGWKQTGEPTVGDAAWNHWTTGYRYAEAIQNETGGGTEGIPDVWMDAGALITTRIVSVEPDTSTPAKGGVSQGFFIKYHIAPTTIMRPQNDPDALVLGEFVLGERPEIEIRVHRTDGPNPGELVRTITAGYPALDPDPGLPPKAQYPAPVPHGRYEEIPVEDGTEELVGEAAYWDGLWDNGPNDGKNAPFSPINPVQYRADLVLDGVVKASSAFEKTA